MRAAVLVAVALTACAPALARASATQESLLEDELQTLQRGPAARERALDDAVALGADGLRSILIWRDIAPAPGSVRRPRGFRSADPHAYPIRNWDRLDDLVRATNVRGLALLLAPSTPIPAWASRCGGSAAKRRVCRPSGREYGAFLQALGRRYSGAYADENQGGGVLPRVRRWSFSNEPNQPSWLRPQFARRRGVTYPEAAAAYRAMVVAGIGGLRASGHGGDQMLLGETAPIGRLSGPLTTRPVPPAAFIRTLLCIDARGGALRGRAAAVRGCTRARKLHVTGFAHHPYTRGGSKPPLTVGDATKEITIASSRRLKRLLDAAARRGRIPHRLPIHYTEYGFQTDPPDHLFGVSPTAQATFINQSDWIAYRDPRIRTVSQYKLLDDPVISSFQSGLRFYDGRVKPAYDAYRLAVWVSRRGETRLRVYGQVRPAAPRAETGVVLENAPLGVSAWRAIRFIVVRSANGTFLVTIPRREGRWRVRWPAPDGAELVSREATSTAG